MARSFVGATTSGYVGVDLSPCQKVTFGFWMYWPSYANDDKLAMEYTVNANSNAGFYVDPNSSSGDFRIQFTNAAGAGKTAAFTRPSAAAWHHYLVAIDRAAITTRVFVDGVDVGAALTGTLTGANSWANALLYLMHRESGSTLLGTGKLADLAIWGHTLLKDGDAKALAGGASPTSIQEPLLLGYWPMDDYVPGLTSGWGTSKNRAATRRQPTANAGDIESTALLEPDPVGTWKPVGYPTPMAVPPRSQGQFACTAWQNTKSIPTSTWTAMEFSGEDFDTDGFHSAAFPSRLVAPVAGNYLVIGHSLRFTVDNPHRGVRFRVNGGSTFGERKNPTGTDALGGVHSVYVFALNAGDYVEVEAFTSGAAEVVTGEATIIRVPTGGTWVGHTTAQSLTNSTWTLASLTADLSDGLHGFSGGVLTPAAGTYLVLGTWMCSNGPGNYETDMLLTKEGFAAMGGGYDVAHGGGCAMALATFDGTTDCELWMNQGSGATKTGDASLMLIPVANNATMFGATSTFSLTHNTFADIPGGTEDVDLGGIHTASAVDYVVPSSQNGYWLSFTHVTVEASGGVVAAHIYKNGVFAIDWRFKDLSSSISSATAIYVANLAVSDAIKGRGMQNSGSTQTAQARPHSYTGGLRVWDIQEITPGAIAATTTVYAPDLTRNDLPRIEATTQVYAPTLSASTTVGFISAATTTYALTALRALQPVGFIAAATSVYALTFKVSYTLPFIPSGTVVVPPKLATAIVNLTVPQISGVAQQGLTLEASPGTWQGTPPLTYSYQWRRCNAAGGACVNIAGATNPAYIVQAADVGGTLRVVVTATNN